MGGNVRHTAADKEGSFHAQHLSTDLLQPVDTWVLPIHIIANFCLENTTSVPRKMHLMQTNIFRRF